MLQTGVFWPCASLAVRSTELAGRSGPGQPPIFKITRGRSSRRGPVRAPYSHDRPELARRLENYANEPNPAGLAGSPPRRALPKRTQPCQNGRVEDGRTREYGANEPTAPASGGEIARTDPRIIRVATILPLGRILPLKKLDLTDPMIGAGTVVDGITMIRRDRLEPVMARARQCRLGPGRHSRTYRAFSTIQSPIAFKASGAMVISIRAYSLGEPVLQGWKR